MTGELRLATVEDVPWLVRLGRQFHAASGYAATIPLDEDDLAKSMRRIIRSRDAFLLVQVDDMDVVHGAIAIASARSFFNASVTVGVEQFFWVDSHARRRGVGRSILRRAVELSRGVGISVLTMVSLEALEPGTAGEFYESEGFTLAEHSYVKRL